MTSLYKTITIFAVAVLVLLIQVLPAAALTYDLSTFSSIDSDGVASATDGHFTFTGVDGAASNLVTVNSYGFFPGSLATPSTASSATLTIAPATTGNVFSISQVTVALFADSDYRYTFTVRDGFSNQLATYTVTDSNNDGSVLINEYKNYYKTISFSPTPVGAVHIDITGVDSTHLGGGVGTATTVMGFVVDGSPVVPPAPTVTSISPSSGPTSGNTSAIITGTNFTGATAVKFGSTTATGYTVNSATQITATSPAGSAGTVDITVTTAGGTSATGSNDQFTYVAAPTVLSITPTSGQTTGGTSVTITGTGFVNGATVKIGSVACASPSVSSSTSLTCTTQANSAGSYNVVVTNPDTQIGTLTSGFTYVANTAPTTAHNTGLTLNQTASATTITSTMLQATDAEQAASALTFTIGTAPSKGTLKNNGTALGTSSTFTQADINNSLITYTPSGTQNGSDSFAFTVSDGAGGSVNGTFNITITDNVAPTASATAATVNNTTSVTTAQSTETGTVYLVKSTVTVTTKASLDSAVTAFTATSAAVTAASSNTAIATTSLADGTYYVYAVDAAGNVSTRSANAITLDSTAPTAAISYSSAGPYTKGATVTITADFSEAVAASPAMQIAVSALTGGSALAATDMTRVSATQYTYAYTVGDGNGTANVTLATGKDLAGNSITSTPASGGSFIANKSASSVSLGSSAASSTYGDTVTLTATVTSGAAGVVDFKEGTTSITGCSTVAVNSGTATCAISALSVGNHSITAAYGGDNTYEASTSSAITQNVNQAALSITADAKSKNYGTTDPSFTYTFSGLASVDTSAVFTGALGRDTGENPGDYTITQGTLSAGANYNITYTSAKLTIVTLGVNGIVVNPDSPQNLVAGLYGAGIMRSSDGGSNWTAATTQPANQGVKALVMHPTTHTLLYAATYGNGIYTSANSGTTWSACAGQPANQSALALAIDTSGTLYVGTEAGIFTSSNCSSWSAVNTGLTVDAATPPAAIAINPDTPATLYAGLDGAGVYRSSDSAVNWASATTQPVNQRVKALVIHPTTRSTLYAATYGGGASKSTDSGDTWNTCANTNLTNLNVVSLTIDSTGKLYAGTEAGVFSSADGCATWTAINGGLP